jgi:dihydropyrimidinase
VSVLIKGGRVITAVDDYVADVFVENGTVALIGQRLTQSAEKVIDATGKYVLPGAIDPHTHLDMPFGGLVTCDDFTSGTRSAAFGGTTTIVDFALQQPGQALVDTIAMWHDKIERCKPLVDVGFHLGITDVEAASLDELTAMPDDGITSFKLFMAYKGEVMVDDETLFRTMRIAAEIGALVLVHAENGDAIAVLREEAVAAGQTDTRYHAITRPPLVEAEATSRAIHLARVAGAPLYVVHVSCQEAIDPIAAARGKRWAVWGETCTQYLFIDETFLARPDFEGGKYIFTPPPRAKEQHAKLWHALASDALSAVSSDHAPFNWNGQKSLGRDDFTKIPNGAPGIENRLHMIHHFGVGGGHLTLNRMVELLSTNPAKLFGLYPRKGTVAVGSDADLVVFDPQKQLTLSAETHHSNVDYNLFEGTTVVGAPEVVLVRGQVIVEDDELVGEPGDGEFVPRARFGQPLLRGSVTTADTAMR